MRKYLLLALLFVGSAHASIKHTNIKMFDVLLKSTIGVRKDIGTAD